MLETTSDYISLAVIAIITFYALRILVGFIFYRQDTSYVKGIDILKDYEEFEE